jgi:hypothetical protein
VTSTSKTLWTCAARGIEQHRSNNESMPLRLMSYFRRNSDLNIRSVLQLSSSTQHSYFNYHILTYKVYYSTMHFLHLPVLFAVSRLALASPYICSPAWGKPGGFYACADKNFSGECGWFPPSDTCWRFPENPSPRSISPDTGGYCIIYDDAECTVQSSSVTINSEQKKL